MRKLEETLKFTIKMLAVAAAVLLPVVGGASKAQAEYPERPIRLIVPFAAGGSTDIIARLIGAKMSELIGQQVLVENRSGAGGNLGSDAVAKSEADGYTILMGTVATHAINPALMPNMPYDPVKDFAPVSWLVTVPNVLVVHPSVKAQNLQELIALLKANPGKFNYASSGNGTPLHLSGELFKMMAGLDVVHVPYRGAGPALNDVTAGQVPIMFDNLPSSIGHIKGGTLRGIAVTTAERSPAIDLPTMAEAGLPGYETYTWNALFAPAGTPKSAIDKLNAVANKAVADPVVTKRLNELSAQVVGSTPEKLADHVKAELAKWAPVVRDSGAKID